VARLFNADSTKTPPPTAMTAMPIRPDEPAPMPTLPQTRKMPMTPSTAVAAIRLAAPTSAAYWAFSTSRVSRQAKPLCAD